MKKFFSLVLAFLFVFAFASCETKSKIVEGSLLFDCGAASLENIESFSILHENGSDNTEITKAEDIELLCHYMYVEDLPAEELPELLTFPKTKRLSITINENSWTLYLRDDGTVTALSEDEGYKTYQADEEYRITLEKFDSWNSTYGG